MRGRLAPLPPPRGPRTGRPSLDHRTSGGAMLRLARTGAPWRDPPAGRMDRRNGPAPPPAPDRRRRPGPGHRRAAGGGAGGGPAGPRARQHRRARPRGGHPSEPGRAGARPLPRRLPDRAPPARRRPRPAGRVPPHRRTTSRSDRRRPAARAGRLAHRRARPPAPEARGGDRRRRARPLGAPRRKGTTPVIPGRADRPGNPGLDREAHRRRDAIERLVARLERFRRVATRHEKLDPHYLAFVQIASVVLRLRTFGDTA